MTHTVGEVIVTADPTPASARFGLAEIGDQIIRVSGGHLLVLSLIESTLVRQLLAAEHFSVPLDQWLGNDSSTPQRLSVLPGLIARGVILTEERSRVHLKLRVPDIRPASGADVLGTIDSASQLDSTASDTESSAPGDSLLRLRTVQADVLGAVVRARSGQWLVRHDATTPTSRGDQSELPSYVPDRRRDVEEGKSKLFEYSTSWRAASAAAVTARLEQLVDVDTGIIAAIRRGSGLPPEIPIWYAGPNRALSTAHPSGLTWRLPGHSMGKGLTDAESTLSALAEAAERWSGTWQPADTSEAVQGADLIDAGLDVVSLDTDSRIPQPFHPGVDLHTGAKTYVPSELVLMGHPPVAAEPRHTDTNGLAAGATLIDATLQALLEVVERDAIHHWWSGAVPSEAITIPEVPRLQPLLDWLRWLGVTVDLRRLASLPGTTTLTAIGWLPETGRFLHGSGTHVNLEIALQRAVLELVQSVAAALATPSQINPLRGVDPAPCPDAQPTITARLPWEVVAESRPETGLSEPGTTQPIDDAISTIVQSFTDMGRRCVLIDVTRDEIQVPLARVLVSGQHGMPLPLR